MGVNPRVLVVDDDAPIRTSLAEALAAAGLDAHTAGSAEEALAAVARLAPDIVLSDVRMPGLGGLDLLRLLKERACDADVIIMTAYDDMPTVIDAMRDGAVEFLVKPLDLDALLSVLQRSLEDRAARAVPRTSVSTGSLKDRLVGRDPQMLEIYKRIGQAAASRVNVLIRGESGTGKELIARAIHEHSPRAREPFTPLNCASLPANLLESELFGHVKGSFTGALAARRGAFAVAGHGTIFLDEIGDTSADFQTKLLRVLQNHEYRPVGSDRTETTHARVLCATHRDLEAMVGAGRFREDLYYRLRVFEINVPPIRARAGDIQILARHFVAAACTALGVSRATLSPEALEAMRRYAWPGNVREIENTITSAVVLAAGGVIRPEHLALTGTAERRPDRLQTLADNEREHIAQVLVSVRGNKTRAAEILGVSRPRLNRLLQKHGME